MINEIQYMMQLLYSSHMMIFGNLIKAANFLAAEATCRSCQAISPIALGTRLWTVWSCTASPLLLPQVGNDTITESFLLRGITMGSQTSYGLCNNISGNKHYCVAMALLLWIIKLPSATTLHSYCQSHHCY